MPTIRGGVSGIIQAEFLGKFRPAGMKSAFQVIRPSMSDAMRTHHGIARCFPVRTLEVVVLALLGYLAHLFSFLARFAFHEIILN